MADDKKVVGFVSSLLSNFLSDAVINPLVRPIGDILFAWLKDNKTQVALLDASRNAESDFRKQAAEKFGNDKFAQVVASFPIHNGELFQSALRNLPLHFDETFLANHLSTDLLKNWHGEFSKKEIRSGIALYLDCLRIRLLQVNGFAEIVMRLAILRTDRRSEEIHEIVKEIRAALSEPVNRKIIESETLLLTRFAIPKPVQDFTGREVELQHLKDAFFTKASVVAISGGGGIGKTELARKFIDEIKDDYPDALISIDLLGTSGNPMSSEDAMRQILGHFYLNQRLPDDFEQLKVVFQHTFSSQKALLLLDNAADATQVRSLIPTVSSVSIITSRQHFSLTEFGLKQPLRLQILSVEQSSALLRNISEKIRESSKLNVDKLSELCGYLPLALRVAASILSDRPDWTIDTLLQRLADEHLRLQRLKRTDDLDLDVEAVISLSYNLLSPEMQRLFRILGVFPMQFWHISAADIWDIKDDEMVNDHIGFLVNHSLLLIQKSHVGVGKNPGFAYYLHDLTRIFAVNKLLENANDAIAATERYANQIIYLSVIARQEFDKGNQSFGIQFFQAILPQFLITWHRMLSQEDAWPHPDSQDSWVSKLPTYCSDLLFICLPSFQLIQILTEALAAARKVSDKKSEQVLLGNLGNAYIAGGYLQRGAECYEKLIDLQRESGDHVGEGKTLGNLGNTYAKIGDNLKSIDLYVQALRIANEVGDKRSAGGWNINLGNVYVGVKDFKKALIHLEKGLSIHRELGERIGEAMALNILGDVYSAMDDIQTGIKYHLDALRIDRETGNRRGEGTTLGALALAYTELGELEKAKVFATSSLVLEREFNNLIAVGKTLSLLGLISTKMNNQASAIKYFEEALKVYESIDSTYVNETREWLVALRDSVNIEDLVDNVVRISRSKGLQAEIYFAKVSQMTRDSNTPQEMQELGRILQKILAGVKSPDLSGLPKELAEMVRNALN